MKRRTGIASVVSKKGRYLEQWLWFHWVAGVDVFYLVVEEYDERIFETIKKLPFFDCIRFVSPINDDKWGAARSRCMDECKWTISLRQNEYLYSRSGDIRGSLEGASVDIPVFQFGPAHHVVRPPGLVIDAYPTCCRTDDFVVAFHKEGDEIVSDDLAVNRYTLSFEDITEGETNYTIPEIKEIHKRQHVDPGVLIHSQKLRRIFSLPVADATSENTVFLSSCDYERPDLAASDFLQSARKNDIDVRWASYGGVFRSFLETKIYRIATELKIQQSLGKKYAFVMDCSDVVFIDHIHAILNRFNDIYDGGVLFNCDFDECLFPSDNEVIRWYIEANYGRNGVVNAGCYVGEIEAILKLIEEVLDIREEIVSGSGRFCVELLSRIGYLDNKYEKSESQCRLIDDDQWLLHIMQMELNPLIRVDRYKRLFSFVWSVPHFREKEVSVYDRNCVSTAMILHGSHPKRRKTSEWNHFIDETCKKENKK